MKIGYVKSIFLILCVTTMQSAQCNSFAETLENITFSYGEVPNTVSLTLPDGIGTVSGNALPGKLLTLSTFSKEWVESQSGDRTPLDIIADWVPGASGSQPKIEFASKMIEKLLASGAPQTLSAFKECAADPTCCLVFIEKCGLAVLQEESKDKSKGSAIEIIIEKTKDHYDDYEAALNKMLTKKGYIVKPGILETLRDFIASIDPRLGDQYASLQEAYIKILHQVILHGDLAKKGCQLCSCSWRSS